MCERYWLTWKASRKEREDSACDPFSIHQDAQTHNVTNLDIVDARCGRGSGFVSSGILFFNLRKTVRYGLLVFDSMVERGADLCREAIRAKGDNESGLTEIGGEAGKSKRGGETEGVMRGRHEEKGTYRYSLQLSAAGLSDQVRLSRNLRQLVSKSRRRGKPGEYRVVHKLVWGKWYARETAASGEGVVLSWVFDC